MNRWWWWMMMMIMMIIHTHRDRKWVSQWASESVSQWVSVCVYYELFETICESQKSEIYTAHTHTHSVMVTSVRDGERKDSKKRKKMKKKWNCFCFVFCVMCVCVVNITAAPISRYARESEYWEWKMVCILVIYCVYVYKAAWRHRSNRGIDGENLRSLLWLILGSGYPHSNREC